MELREPLIGLRLDALLVPGVLHYIYVTYGGKLVWQPQP